MRTPRNKVSRASPVVFCKAAWTSPIARLRPTSLIHSISSSMSSAGLDGDTFPKYCSSTDTTRMRTCSTTARCSWPSRITYEHRHRIHTAVSHRFGVCPEAFRTHGQRRDPRAESLYGPHGSTHRQGRDDSEPRLSNLAGQSECSWFGRVHRNESHSERRSHPDQAKYKGYPPRLPRDRKSTRLNSSHLGISYAV